MKRGWRSRVLPGSRISGLRSTRSHPDDLLCKRRGTSAITTQSDPVLATFDRAPAHGVRGFWLGAASRRADLVALVVLVLTIIIGARDMLLDPVRAGLDSFTFFWPMYEFLGEQLRSGNVPGWNPYQFSGVPFAADPESGWMYLPAMLIFTLMPLAAAIKVYAVAHILIAGWGTYVYGRVIGLIPAGALVAAWAVTQGGLFSDRSRCCYTHIQVATWIPVALLGVEIAVRAVRHTPRMLAWLLTAFAISQMLAGWIGQGAMYGLMLVAAYVAFRTLFHLPRGWMPIGPRLAGFAANGAIPMLMGMGLAAPGLLPRLAYYRESNLADGYSGSAAWAAQIGGWTFGHQLERILGQSGWWIVGIIVFVLANVAIGHRQHTSYVLFFGLLSIAGFTLGLERHTLLHQALFTLVPGFEDMHTHFPERIALIFQFGPAMLAGFGMTALLRRPGTAPLAISILCLAGAAVAMYAARLDLSAQSWVTIGIAIAILCLMWLALKRGQTATYRVLTVALLASVIIDLQAAAWSNLRHGSYARVETASIMEPNAIAEIIMEVNGDPDVPPRFFGYDPALSFPQHGETTYYRHDFTDGMTYALLVNNRGTLWGLADIQGYNPLQLSGYVAYVSALNGQPQEYHGSYVLAPGLDSPLLPLLAPEFIVVPLTIPQDRLDLQVLVERHPEVATTEGVRILRFTDVFPRAWIVHDMQRFDGNLSAAITGPPVDFRQTALVEEEVGSLDPASGSITETATITGYSPDALTVEVTSDGAGLLVLSEIFAQGWTATVDGVDQEVIAANGALRGIEVPSGLHTVRLSFEPPGLKTGYGLGFATGILAVSGVTGAMSLDRRSSRLTATGGARHDSPAADPPA